MNNNRISIITEFAVICNLILTLFMANEEVVIRLNILFNKVINILDKSISLNLIQNVIGYLLAIFILLISVKLTTKFSISNKLRNTHLVILSLIGGIKIILSFNSIKSIMWTIFESIVILTVTVLFGLYTLFKYDNNDNNNKFYLFLKSKTIYTNLMIICIFIFTIILLIISMTYTGSPIMK